MNTALSVIALCQVARFYLFWKSEREKNAMIARLLPIVERSLRSLGESPVQTPRAALRLDATEGPHDPT